MKRTILSVYFSVALLTVLVIPIHANPADDTDPLVTALAVPNEVPVFETSLTDKEKEPDIIVDEEQPVGAFSIYAATDKADATSYIREQLVKHADPIAVSIPVTSSTSEKQTEEFKSCLDAAWWHTGVPKEGDFLRFNMNGYSLSKTNKVQDRVTFTFSPNYRMTAAQQTALDKKVALITYSFGFSASTSDYDKVRSIYDFLCTHVSFASNTKDTGISHSTYAALNLETTVSQGFATAFYRLALESGLDARVITGVGNGEDHAWNIVKIDGKWYYVDAAWDTIRLQQAGAGYAYFLKGTKSGEFPNHSANVDTSGKPIVNPPSELSKVSSKGYTVPLEILIQPQDINTYIGNKEIVAVVALGNGPLSYHWVITLADGRTTSAEEFGFETEKISQSNLWLYDGMTCYCIVTDSTGQSVISETMTMHVLDNTKAKLAGYTASFYGDIALNYYMNLTSEVLNSETAFMRFTIPGETTKTVKIPVSDAVPKVFTVNGKKVTYYQFKASTAAKDMGQFIHAEFYLDKKTKAVDQYYSVKEYADYIYSNPDTYGKKASDMVRAMLNYGGYAQINFKYHTEDLANIDLADVSVPNLRLGDDVAFSKTGTVPGIDYKGSKLVLRTSTLLWHYFQVSGNIRDYTFKVDDKTIAPTAASSMGENWYRIEIAGIPAKQLDHFYKLVITKKNTSGTQAINYCAYSNIKSITDNPSAYTEANVNMMKALYVFGEKTKAYFA